MATLEISLEANCDRQNNRQTDRQTDRRKKPLIGAQATALPNNEENLKQAELGVPHSKSKLSWPKQNFG